MTIVMKYTPELQKMLVDGYTDIDWLMCSDEDKHDAREAFILAFSRKHTKSKASIIAKLSKLGIYKKRPKLSKVTGGKPETKEQIVAKLANKWGLNPEQLVGLDKAPKLVLVLILNS